MAESTTIQELLSRWEREGRPPPEQLCRDHPAQLDELKKAVDELQSMESFLASRESTIHYEEKVNQSGEDMERCTTDSLSNKPPPSSGVPAPDVSTQRTLGRYELRTPIGRGGFGEVWQAYHPDLKKIVAIKRPRPGVKVSVDELDLFLAEAQKAAQLRHSAIVSVLDVERDGDSWFIVSEFIEGVNLKDYVAKNPISIERAVEIIAAIAEALDAAHRKRLIHRDVKPGNILIDREGKPYLTDFGLALSEEEQEEEKGGVAGTPSYMSPEQLEGRTRFLDGRSDIFSLGVVLYELLTGDRPFKGKTRTDIREQILKREPKPPRAINENISPELERICLKCLEKSIRARYPTGADLAKDLRASLQPPKTRSGLVVAAGISGIIVLLLIAAYFVTDGFSFGDSGRSGDQGVSKDTTENPKKTDPKRTLDGWQTLWLDQPEKIGPANSSATAGNNSIVVFCQAGTCVAKLDELSAPSYRIRVGVEPDDWECRIGVFFGWRKIDNTGRKFRFQFLRMSLSPLDGKQHELLISRWITPKYDVNFGGFPEANPIKYSKFIQRPELRGELEFAVENYKLKEVLWNKTALTDLVSDSVNRHFTPEDYQGEFGFFVYNGSVRFDRPQIKLDDAP